MEKGIPIYLRDPERRRRYFETLRKAKRGFGMFPIIIPPENVSVQPASQRRWMSPQRPDAAVACNSKGQAEIFFKNLLGVQELPTDFIIKRF